MDFLSLLDGTKTPALQHECCDALNLRTLNQCDVSVGEHAHDAGRQVAKNCELDAVDLPKHEVALCRFIARVAMKLV